MRTNNRSHKLNSTITKMNRILLFFSAAVLSAFIARPVSAQDVQSLSGTVFEDGGLPAVGAVVYYDGQKETVLTDVDGKFSISYRKGKILTVSLLGFKEAKMMINDLKPLKITLETDAEVIEDAVVIGYGVQSRKDLTGSVASVKADEIAKTGSNNVIGALQGHVAGLNITSESGEPGVGYQIKIRGNNSINAGSSPLFVIDGMQMDVNSSESASDSNTSNSSFDPLAFLNPNDIESIEVLKDASATAIYGARGANGVVIVTTKSGAATNRTLVNFDASVSVSQVPKYIEMLNNQEWIEYRYYRKDQGWTNYADIDDPTKPMNVYTSRNAKEQYKQNYDWQQIMYRNAVTQNYNLSVSAKAGKGTQILASIGYMNQQGLVIGNDYNRITGRLKVDHTVNDKWKLGANVNFGRNVTNGAVSTSGAGAVNVNLIQMIYLERPVNFLSEEDAAEYPRGLKPLTTLVNDLTYRKLDNNRLNGNAYLEYKPVTGLTLRASAAGSWAGSTLWQYYNSQSRWGMSHEGYGVFNQVNTLTYNASLTATYRKTWNKRHNFDAMIGGELSSYHTDYMKLAREGFEEESTGAFDIFKGMIAYDNGSSQSYSTSTRMGFFSRVNYNYKSKYYASVNFRADGSSKFYAGNRVGYFPSGSIAWRLSNEPWMKSAKKNWLDDLKIRASAGASGNDRISTYASLATLTSNKYTDGESSVMGMSPSTSANPNLKWETTYQYDAGLDWAMFKDRFRLTFDAYYKDTRDMLYKTTVSAQSGYFEQWQNIGRVENKGLELAIDAHVIAKRHFGWKINLTYDMCRNKVLDIGNVEYTSVNISSGNFAGEVSRIMVGQPIGVGYGYVFDGNYQLSDFNIWYTTEGGKKVIEDDPSVITSDNIGNYTFELKTGEGATAPGIQSRNPQPGDRKYKDIDGDGIITEADKTVISDGNPKFTAGLGNTFYIYDFELSFFFEGVYGREILNEFKVRSESGLSGGTAHNNITRASYQGHWTPENQSNTYAALKNDTNTWCSSYYVEDGSFIRLKNIALSYKLPDKVCHRIKIQGLKFTFNVDNVFVATRYSGLDPDVSFNNAIFSGFDRMSYPKARSYRFGLNFTF